MKRTAIPRGYEGPVYREGRDVPCHVCEAAGVIEEGVQVDIDDFVDCLCDNCDGTGIEPWRPAGKRDTGAPKFTDPLVDLARQRAAVMSCKARLGSWRERGISIWYDSALRRAMAPTLIELSVAEAFAQPRAQLALHQFDLQDYARRLLGVAA